MVLLDTDHMSLLQRGRMAHSSAPSRSTTSKRQVFDYKELKKLLHSYCSFAVLDYEVEATTEFQRLRALKIRVGTMDLKIAAIALNNNATPLTRNISGFGKVPCLRVDDWSS